MTAKKAAAPKTRRPTTNALLLARNAIDMAEIARDNAQGAVSAARMVVQLLEAEDARTGKQDPHLRRRRRSPGASA